MSDSEEKKHVCKFCKKEFTSRMNLWKHLNTKKTSCVPKEKVEELFQENNQNKSQLTYFEKKTKKQEEEIKNLKRQLQLMEKISENNSRLENKIDEVFDKQEDMICKIEESNNLIDKGAFISAQNQFIINNNKVDLNIDQRHGNFFDLHLNKEGKERLDHIDIPLMMKILSAKSFPKSMGRLIASVYFHPKAPENYRWCVTDITAQSGALQYSEETGTLYRTNTNDTISKNVKNVMFGVTDVLVELGKTKSFNDNQAINYSQIVNLMGNELSESCLNEIKETAYQHRHFPRTAWKYMNIPIDTKPCSAQQKLERISL